MRIAVLDDDPAQLAMIERVAQEMGHSCALFSEGQALMLALRRDTFDLLVVDWELPPAALRWCAGRGSIWSPSCRFCSSPTAAKNAMWWRGCRAGRMTS